MSTTTESDPAHATAPLQRDWHDEQTLYGDYSGPVLSVRALSDAVLRVRLAPDGQFAPRRSWAVVPPDETFPPVVPEFGTAAGQAEIGTASLIARLEPGAARVTICERSSGRELLADDSSDLPRTGEPLRWVKCLPDARTCHFYGFGERTGLLDKRGRRFTCWNTDRYEDQSANTDELYLSVPFFLSLNGRGESFGLFLNNTYRSAFDLSEVDEGRLTIEIDGGELDYYLIYGPDPADVVTRFADLTGRMPMPPRWSLGYHQARWSYGSDDEVRGIAGELRSRQIPADAICVDIDSMDELRVFTWDPARFPDPPALANDLREQGIRLIKVVDVGVKYEDGEDYPVLQEGIDHGYFLRTGREPEDPPFLCYVWPGLCAFPDFARAEVREWWGQQYRVLIDDGISGVLNDMNEPAMHDKPYDDPEGFRTDPPPTLPHGPAEEPATHAEIHNLYGFLQAKATRAGLLRIRPDERPFVISRAGFAGIQQYAATWTGDNWSTWDHLEMSLPQLLNMGLSGIPFAGADIGGFYGNCEPELFARWMQLGAFYPFARSNSAKGTARQEPWAFGCDVEAVARRALELRYRLLPYLYTVFEEATRTGLPILRPLFLHYADDPAAHRIHDQALAGRDLLIAPVVRPGKRTREVYFPRGTWFDRRTGDRLTGPAHALIPASLDMEIPLFGRGGSVIPSGPTLEWTDQHPLHELTLDIYPDEHGAASGVLYEDDGRSLAYEHADWRTTTFSFAADTGILRARATGEHASPVQSVVVRRHDIDREVRFAAPQRADEWEIEV